MTRPSRLQLAALCLIVLAAFALYAGAVRLMPFHDDAVLMPAIDNRTLLTIFENRPYGDGHHRPMSYVPWLLTRDLFGWFIAPVLHLWNVWAHVVNVALVGALAARLARAFDLRAPAFPILAAAIFAFAPLSYEAVLWASALVHPLMAAFGLAALNAYLAAHLRPRRRGPLLVAAAALLLAACLSHEMGFIFGPLTAVIALGLALRARRRPDPFAFLLAGLTLGYALIYRFALITKWTDPASRDYARDAGEIIGNIAYQAQNLASGAFVLAQSALRAAGATPIQADPAAVLAVAATAVLAGLAALWLAARRTAGARAYAMLGALALAMWAALIAPSALLLTQDYVWSSPRMTYAPSIAAALFWGAVGAAGIAAVRGANARAFAPRWIVGAAGAATIALSAWSAGFAHARLAESARLTPALREIDAALRASDPAARLLLINSSFSNFANPTFFPIGREGMPIWEYGYKVADGPMWAWPAAVSGTVRETANVRHLPSLANRNPDVSSGYYFTTGEPFTYGVFGDEVDDGALQARILSSDLVYRFHYDPPGFRAVRLARFGPPAGGEPAARLSLEVARVDIAAAQAARCDGRYLLDVTWSGAADIARPAGVFVHGYDATGQRVAVADLDPAGGSLPLDRLPADRSLAEVREVMPGADVGEVVEFRIGAYDRETGQRFAALRADGAPWPGDEVIVPVHAANAARLQSGACP